MRLRSAKGREGGEHGKRGGELSGGEHDLLVNFMLTS